MIPLFLRSGAEIAAVWLGKQSSMMPKRRTALLTEARLEIDSPVIMKVEDNRIVIEALQGSRPTRLKLPFCEADLLAGLNADTAHADEATDPLLDEELGDW